MRHRVLAILAAVMILAAGMTVLNGADARPSHAGPFCQPWPTCKNNPTTTTVAPTTTTTDPGTTTTTTTTTTTSVPGGTGDLFVTPSGSPTSNCATDAPCTLQRAASLVNPGQTVLVRDGTYSASYVCNGLLSFVCVNRGGSATQRVTWKSESLYGAVLDGDNAVANGFSFQTGGNFVTVDGFWIRELRELGNSSSGFELFNGGDDVLISNNQISNIGQVCTNTTNGQVGVFTTRARVVVRNNWIHDIGRIQDPFCPNAQDIHDHAIYDNAGGPLTVELNLFENIQYGFGVQVYPGPVNNTRIDNNIFREGATARGGSSIIVYRPRWDGGGSISGNFFHDSDQAGYAILWTNPRIGTPITVANNTTSHPSLFDVAAPSGVVQSGTVLNTAC
jgi:hypothetical protein